MEGFEGSSETGSKENGLLKWNNEGNSPLRYTALHWTNLCMDRLNLRQAVKL